MTSIKTEAGYYKGEDYYFDVFLAPIQDNKPPLPENYKRFRAKLAKTIEINILLTKSQVQGLGGLELQDFRDDFVTDSGFGQPYRSYSQSIECMLPVYKVSNYYDLFQIQEFLQGIQVLENDVVGDPHEIIVGYKFLTQLGFNIFRPHPKMMHTRITEQEDMQEWALEFENLGMYEAAKLELDQMKSDDVDAMIKAIENQDNFLNVIENEEFRNEEEEEEKFLFMKAGEIKNGKDFVSNQTAMESENIIDKENEAGLSQDSSAPLKSKDQKEGKADSHKLREVSPKSKKIKRKMQSRELKKAKKKRKKQELESCAEQIRQIAKKRISEENVRNAFAHLVDIVVEAPISDRNEKLKSILNALLE